jgi:transcriptional regulator with XRE-family HTH domain
VLGEQLPATESLSEAIVRSGHTGTSLARTLKISETQVSRWRNGLVPSRKSQERIVRALNRKLEQPITEEDLWPTG